MGDLSKTGKREVIAESQYMERRVLSHSGLGKVDDEVLELGRLSLRNEARKEKSGSTAD